MKVDSAELSHSLKSFGSASKHDEMGPEAFGIIVCRSVRAVPCILGLIWRRFGPKPDSKSKIFGQIHQRFPGPFSSAEVWSTFGHDLRHDHFA